MGLKIVHTDNSGYVCGFEVLDMTKSTIAILSSFLVFSLFAQARSFVHDTITEPIPDIIRLDLPESLANRKLAALGLVDITSKPFGADPTGKADSTEAIQAAINFARDHQMPCFFPSGTYKTSNTLSCIQGYYRRRHGKVSAAPNFPCVLVGSSDEDKPRPRIILAPDSPGYGNPQKPKYVVHFWTRSTENPNSPQPNICFNQMFIGIDITIGRGNPGAVAIRLRGAQGSGVQDCTIDATGGLTGLEGSCGSGGSHTNIKIIGGRTGMDLRETQPAPTITGITLINQRDTAILYGGRQALCAVGIRIISEAKGPAIKIAPQWDVHFQGPLVLVDSHIVFRKPHPENTLLSATRSFYLNNVYTKNAATIAHLPGHSKIPGNPNGWLRIKEYAQSIGHAPYKGLKYASSVYIDGKKTSDPLIIIEPDKTPPEDLQSRHLWPKNFPTWQSKNAVDVTAPPYNAKADGLTDDTAALQRAIYENATLLLPRGIYRITRTLKLKPDTKIIGVGKAFSIIAVRAGEGFFTDNTSPKPLIETADSKQGNCIMAFCGIYVPYEAPGAYALKWSTGRNSICRDVDYLLVPGVGFGRKIPVHAPRITPFVKITGSGGGKWYNFELGKGLADPGYRQILVEGTSEPLSFYHLCPEGTRSEANMEIADSRNVSLYGFKGEGNTFMLWIRNSDHIRLFGYGGNASARTASTLFKIENTPNFLLANIIDHPMPKGKPAIRGAVGTDPEKYYMIIEQTSSGSSIKTTPLDRPTLYKRGSPKTAD